MITHISLFPSDRPTISVGEDITEKGERVVYLQATTNGRGGFIIYQGITRTELAKLAADINKFLGLGEPTTPSVSDAAADAEASHQRLAEQTAAIINAAQEELAQPQANQFPAH